MFCNVSGKKRPEEICVGRAGSTLLGDRPKIPVPSHNLTISIANLRNMIATYANETENVVGQISFCFPNISELIGETVYTKRDVFLLEAVVQAL